MVEDAMYSSGTLSSLGAAMVEFWGGKTDIDAGDDDTEILMCL